ncbi:MAG: hypothetical protein ACYS7Y_35865 [Planctomycetota bacterium]|jgi:hypothetical protein
MQQELPTVESLTAQITNMVVQRAQAKDQVEAIVRLRKLRLRKPKTKE